MGVLDRIKLNAYPELKKLNISNDLLKSILSNKNFKKNYKTKIKGFLKNLSESPKDSKKIDNSIIVNHLKCILELSDTNSIEKYIYFINENLHQNYIINNLKVINDSNFEILFSMIGDKIFDDNIAEIIEKGYSSRLIEFINGKSLLEKPEIKNLTFEIFEDKIWSIINTNPMIGNKSAIIIFRDHLDILCKLIDNGLFEGLKYTYDTIPESRTFIESFCKKKDGTYSLEQFSMEFIKNVGIEALKKLYYAQAFLDDEAKIIPKLVKVGNFEYIKDVANWNPTFLSSINENDIEKSLLEIQSNKLEIFLNKYFGISAEDIRYLKLFLDTLNKLDLPLEFQKKYGHLLQLLNRVYTLSNEEITSLSKSISTDSIEKYKILMKSLRKEGKALLSSQFASDLKQKNSKTVDISEKKKITTDDGKEIDVFELSGQPFTMLVHTVTDNRLSVHNSHVAEITKDIKNWENINSGNEFISTSLISDKFMAVYGYSNPSDIKVIFGFCNLEDDSVRFNSIKDAGVERKTSKDAEFTVKDAFNKEVYTLTTVDDLMTKTIEYNKYIYPENREWNEVIISRKSGTTGKKITPDFVVCMDTINQTSIEAAKYFNIPIYLIHRKAYKDLPYIEEKKDNKTEFDSTDVEHKVR